MSLKDLYAVSGNAGWKVKPLYEDQPGWEMADFVFGFRDNGVAVLVKNRRSGNILDFIAVSSLMNYMQNYYDANSEGVDIHNMAFEKLRWFTRSEQRQLIRTLIDNNNRNVKHKEILTDGEIKL